MSALETAVEFIARWEGMRLKPYQDQGGVWTVGYGATRIAGRPVSAATEPLSAVGARTLLLGDVGRFLDQVRRLVTVEVSDAELAALTSLAFNIGVGAFAGSTLLRLLNDGKRDLVPEQFLRWNRAGGRWNGGLARRRAAERALFVGLPAGDHPVAPARPRPTLTPEPWLSEAELLNAASLAVAIAMRTP